jgi:hypothetical protein
MPKFSSLWILGWQNWVFQNLFYPYFEKAFWEYQRIPLRIIAEFPGIPIFIRRIAWQYTVSRRVVKNPKSDFFNSSFLNFYSIVSILTKKIKTENPLLPPDSRYGPPKWKLWRKFHTFLFVVSSTLEANISGSIWNLFSIFILIREVFCQLFSDVYDNFKKYVVFELDVKMQEKK